MNRWYPNTVINGVDVSNMTYSQSKSAFKKQTKNYELNIIGKGDVPFTIEGIDIDLKVDYEATLKNEYASHKKHRGIFSLLKNHDKELSLKVTYDQDKLNQLIQNSILIVGSDTYQIVTGQSASIEYDEKTGAGKIVPGVAGNQVNPDKLIKVVNEAIAKINTKIELADEKSYSGVYTNLSKSISDKKMKKLLNDYNNYLLNWINWDMGEGVTESLTPTEIKDWLSLSDEKIVFDSNAMGKWVEKLCLKYKTVGAKREFNSHSDGVITVSGGDFGWRLDYDTMVEKVKAKIEEKKDQTLIDAYVKKANKTNQDALTTNLEPDYSNKGYKKDYTNFKNDWDTQNYSEVDISDQKVYVYKDGQLAYETICVTGLPSDPKRATQTGVWFIKEKKLDKVLIGDDYKTPTKYWIRITWTGTGYHYLSRSDWTTWSPEVYKTKGSHGCINLQIQDAEAIYNLLKINDVVFIHE